MALYIQPVHLGAFVFALVPYYFALSWDLFYFILPIVSIVQQPSEDSETHQTVIRMSLK